MVRRIFKSRVGLLAAVVCLFPRGILASEKITVAVASNFAMTLKQIATEYEKSHELEIVLVPGSTGKLYKQIELKAPFDIFFAADVERPKLLEKNGIGIEDTRFTYVVGKLALWSLDPDLVDSGENVLREGDFRFLSIANPKLAPYGKAAQETLEKMELWAELKEKIVRGENISQAFHFVASGNAELGLIALSQIVQKSEFRNQSSWWEIPSSFYSPIEQQAILIKDSSASRDFLDFVRKDDLALKIIRQHGYAVP